MNKIAKSVAFLLGVMIGYGLGELLLKVEMITAFFHIVTTSVVSRILFDGVIGIIFGIIFVLILPLVLKALKKLSSDSLQAISKFSLAQILTAATGLILGLVTAGLLAIPVGNLPIPDVVKSIIIILLFVALGYLGVALMTSKNGEIQFFWENFSSTRSDTVKKTSRRSQGCPKILDTSVIIDGRIYDMLQTGFIEGQIVVPAFVLSELQLLADGEDDLKRVRGRRGLDMVRKMQTDLDGIDVVISQKDYKDIKDVDNKLLKLAREMKGKVVTNDYNLSKIAHIYHVAVLNTNDMSNAVKTVVVPGEEMVVNVLREGKENNQGVAYLDDGTMIVVENGRDFIGKTITAVVTSVLQTAAGRMIFAKPVF